MKTEIELTAEYQILDFLNIRVEKYDLFDDDVKKFFDKIIDQNEIENALNSLKQTNRIGYKTDNDKPKGLTIRDNGYAKLNELKGRINAISSEENTKKAIKRTILTTCIGAILGGAISLIPKLLPQHEQEIKLISPKYLVIHNGQTLMGQDTLFLQDSLPKK